VPWFAKSQLNFSFPRGMMRYTVYKQTHRENVRWYIRPLMASEPKDNCIVFEGKDGILLACEKARELNDKEGRLALAA
jgi:hypothetical protein